MNRESTPTGSNEPKKYLARILAADGASIREQWTFFASDDQAAGAQVAQDPRIKPGDDYLVTEKKS